MRICEGGMRLAWIKSVSVVSGAAPVLADMETSVCERDPAGRGDEPTRNSDSMLFSLRVLRSRLERAAAYAPVQPERYAQHCNSKRAGDTRPSDKRGDSQN